jgi:tetratricopeptide (TPR) repeat protein
MQNRSFRAISRTSTRSCQHIGLEEVERFLCVSLSEFSHDRTLVVQVQQVLGGMSDRLRSKCLQECWGPLSEVLAALDALLTTSPNLPAAVLYEVHSYIGLFNLYLEQYATAQAAFLKALWVASSSTELREAETPRSLHRLGMAYAESGQLDQARSVFEKALQEYKNTRTNHHFRAQVIEILKEIKNIALEETTE